MKQQLQQRPNQRLAQRETRSRHEYTNRAHDQKFSEQNNAGQAANLEAETKKNHYKRENPMAKKSSSG
jgi:hypothetical protein